MTTITPEQEQYAREMNRDRLRQRTARFHENARTARARADRGMPGIDQAQLERAATILDETPEG